MKKILFIGYGEPDASSRYRAEQYYNKIKNELSDKFVVDYYRIYPSSHIFFQKYNMFLLFFIMFYRKLFSLYKCRKFDIIFLQKNTVDILSPFYEVFIKYVLRKKIIFDFDDSIWMLKGKYNKKVEWIIKLSDAVIVGNKFLHDYAIKFNNRIYIINTVIDTDKYKFNCTREKQKSCINICWIGSKPGNNYITNIEHVFINIKTKYKDKVAFFIVSSERPCFQSFNDYKYLNWSKKVELEILCKSDIGIMPIADSKIARGKCGFKLIQYGSYSLVSVASPIGLNNEIIRNGVNGFLADNEKEWVAKLSFLINNRDVLEKMKRQSRELVISKYSLKATLNNFILIIESV